MHVYVAAQVGPLNEPRQRVARSGFNLAQVSRNSGGIQSMPSAA